MRLARDPLQGAGLAFVVLVGLALRIYNLGTPSQWMDEILVTLNANHPVEYILELCRKIEVHSPFFYGIIKTVMLVDSGDFALRLPSLLAGAVTVYLAYRLGADLGDERTGLYAAVFIALNPHHLYLSRYVRPYALVVFLFCLSLVLTRRAAREDGLRACLWLAVVDCLMLLLHNLAVLPLGAQLIYLASQRLKGTGKPRWSGLFLVASTVSAGLGLLWWFFLRGSSVAGEFFAQPMGVWEATLVVGECFLRNLYYFDVPLAWGLGFAACVGGVWVMWRRDRWAAYFAALFLFLPAFMLVASGMAWNLWARHLCWVIPLAAVAWAELAASARLSSRGHVLAACATCLCGAIVYLVPAHDRYFNVDSYRDRVIGTNYKVLARRVLEETSPRDALVATHDYFRNGINWYADRLGGINRFRFQSIDRQAGRMSIRVLADLHYGYFAKGRQDFIERHAPSSVAALEENVHLFTLDVERSPEFEIGAPPSVVSVPMDMVGFHSKVGSLSNAVYSRDARGPFVMTTKNNTLGQMDYYFQNSSHAPVSRVILNAYFRNVGKGNHIVLETAFDDEPPVTHPLTMGPDPRSNAVVSLGRDKPFETLRVGVRMVCAPSTPLFPGGNFETLRFEGLDAAFSDTYSLSATQTEMQLRREENDLRNFLAERFIAKKGVEQRMLAADAGLISEADPDVVGWERLVVVPGTEKGVFLAEVARGNERLIVYPRVGGGASIGFYQISPDGRRHELLTLKGREGAWTPISAQYQLSLNPAFSVGDAYRVEILLQGRWAQLWNKNGTIFFAE